jgi:hypothetical protein
MAEVNGRGESVVRGRAEVEQARTHQRMPSGEIWLSVDDTHVCGILPPIIVVLVALRYSHLYRVL